ncbi:MAG: nucleotide exchange factor GrpE [Marivibrio sp.]|uniref:nucleotide exchange factor GrpE n=1 Tax=Marivibrio sp. TaxID=2039719 RepID=UPI0032EEBBD7
MTGKDQAKKTDDQTAHTDSAEPGAASEAERAAEKAVDDALRQARGEGPADADAAEATQAASEGGDPTAEIARLQAENAEMKDRMMRVVADAENTKRRAEKDAADARKYAASSFVKEILPAVDNLRRAVDSVPEAMQAENETVKNLVVGVEMTEKQILDALAKGGVRKMDPKGEKFSYDHHQAISEATGTGQPAGTIVDVLQPGYMLHDRLLRPAMVVVAKGDAGAPANDAKDGPKDGGGVDTTA